MLRSRRWVAEKIEFVGYIEATRLAKVGEAKDPAAALEDLRAKAKTGMQASRQKRVANVSNSPEPAAPPARPPRGNEAVPDQSVAKGAMGSSGSGRWAMDVSGWFCEAGAHAHRAKKLLLVARLRATAGEFRETTYLPLQGVFPDANARAGEG
jgi:hypothetical protein